MPCCLTDSVRLGVAFARKQGNGCDLTGSDTDPDACCRACDSRRNVSMRHEDPASGVLEGVQVRVFPSGEILADVFCLHFGDGLRSSNYGCVGEGSINSYAD